MIAKLLIHPNLPSRIGELEKILASQGLKKDHADVLWIEDEKLGVEVAKKIRAHLSLKPFSAHGRAVIIENTQNFTDDAQNSLLKTLEEPPTEALILMGADSEKNILPTVLSRCEIIFFHETMGHQNSNQSGSFSSAPSSDIDKLMASTIEQRFGYIEKLEEKEVFLQSLLKYFHSKLSKNPKYPKFAKELMKAEQWSKANGNSRAILEYLVLILPD